ncbi:MAG: nucleotide exchange factor GrpE [Candidatus Delongbacteria bacterium]|nr:nucleotide exchange factor GrpE [Candidatus Delongbacteria bacterium]MBN2834726.1 nucleotide exchange factor GrpE [Candidatus Delongbacteria bacterium]
MENVKENKEEKDLNNDIINDTDNNNESIESDSEETTSNDSENISDASKASSDDVCDKLTLEVMEYREKLLRKAAEFENYKKRTSQEFVRLIDSANEGLVLKMIPVLDDIERFDKNYNDKIDTKELKKGVDLIFEKFKSIMKSIGLVEMESIGKEFNPDLHEALLQVENSGKESNTIIDEHEKGYFLKEKIIRHSKVIVAK